MQQILSKGPFQATQALPFLSSPNLSFSIDLIHICAWVPHEPIAGQFVGMVAGKPLISILYQSSFKLLSQSGADRLTLLDCARAGASKTLCPEGLHCGLSEAETTTHCY